MKRLRAGILGLCHLHPVGYMPIFAAVEGLEVVAAAEANREVREKFVAEFSLRGYEDWRSMIEREALDLAVLFLPHAECPDAAVACAGQGIHLLIEKPMAAGSAGLRRAISAAQEAGVLLSTPYVWRYHPVCLRMKKYARDGTLGRIVGCQGRCAAGRMQRYIDGNAQWMLDKALSGGGPMVNLGVHWIDLFRWLLEDEVVEVVGKNVRVSRQYDIEDNSFAIATFSRGTVLALDVSYTVPDSFPCGRDLFLSLRGTAGVLSWSPSFEGLRERLFVCSDAGEFAANPCRQIDFQLEPQPGYAGILAVRFLTELVQSIRDNRAPAITGEDALCALEVAEAVYRSAETGRAVQLARS